MTEPSAPGGGSAARGPIAALLAGSRVVRDVGSTFAGNAFGAAAAFLAGLVLAKWLGPDLRGTFELGIFWANGAILVLGLGLSVPTTVFIVRRPALGRWAYALGLSVTTVWALLGVLSVMAGARSTRNLHTGIALAVIAVFASLQALQLANGLLIGVGRIQRQNMAVASRWASYLILLTLLSALLPPRADLALACFAAAALLGAGVAWSGLRGVDRAWGRGTRAFPERKEVLWFGVKAQFANVFQFASYRFDVLLVSIWVGRAGLGIYSVGVMFAEALWLLPNAVGTVVLSHTSRSDPALSNRRIGRIFTATMLTVCVAGIMLAVAARVAVRWYLGTAYAEVPEVTWLLLPGAVALSGNKVVANELVARGFPGINTLIALAGAAITLLGDVALIPRYGILGASVASSIGYSAAFAMSWRAFRRRVGVPLIVWPPWIAATSAG